MNRLGTKQAPIPFITSNSVLISQYRMFNGWTINSHFICLGFDSLLRKNWLITLTETFQYFMRLIRNYGVSTEHIGKHTDFRNQSTLITSWGFESLFFHLYCIYGIIRKNGEMFFLTNWYSINGENLWTKVKHQT